MRQLILGFVIGSLIFGAIGFYAYNTEKGKTATANTKIVQLEKAGNNNAMQGPPLQDASTLAAVLRNKRLEDLASAKGEAFDHSYIMFLDTTYGELSMLAKEAKDRADITAVREIAEKVYADTNSKQSELIPLRSQFNLIH